MNLFDLPKEIIQCIFNCIPNKQLIKLIHIPIIKHYAAFSLYSSIRIRNNRHKIEYGLIDDNGIPLLNNAYSYIVFLESNPNIKPKRLIIDDPFDAIILVKNYPNYLTNMTVEVVSSCGDYDSQVLEGMVELFEKGMVLLELDLQLSVDHIHGISTSSIVLHTKYLSLTRSISNDVILLENWPNLTEISMRNTLNENQLIRLPRQLQKLKCDLRLYDLDIESGAVNLDFPNGLRELIIQELYCYTDNLRIIELSHLPKLQMVLIHDCYPDSLVLCALNLPKALATFHIGFIPMISMDLKTMCPGLTDFTILEAEYWEDSDYSKFSPPILPLTLQRLVVPASCFHESLYGTPESNLGRSFGSKLRVFGYTAQKAKFIDNQAEMSCFEKSINQTGDSQKAHLALKNLEIYGSICSHTILNFGRDLTRLSLRMIPMIHYMDFRYLPNLAHLLIRRVYGTKKLKVELPDSLKNLEIDSCPFNTMHIIAPNLTSLNIIKGIFRKLDDEHFTFPKNLTELRIHKSKVKTISVKLSDCIEILDLSGNANLKYIYHFPASLKSLSLCDTAIGKWYESRQSLKYYSPPNFPLSLESLYLSAANIDTLWLRKSNLNDCHNLKTLELRHNIKINEFDLSYLPKSLAVLDFSYINIDSFIGKFKCLPNLETISLAGNKLSEYFETIAKEKQPCFSDKIKVVDLQCCWLTQTAMNTIYDELIEKPGFERLLLSDESSLPDSKNISATMKIKQEKVSYIGFFEHIR